MQSPIGRTSIASYAGFWKRFVAYLIDKLILSVVTFILFIPVLGLLGIGALAHEDVDDSVGFLIAFIGAYAMAIVLIIVADWLYFALMESKKGATLGKMVLNITVTDTNGSQISFGRATGRYFGKILSGLIFCVGYIMAGFTQQKQALHDILAGTLVVNK
ncbi:MAG: RDD family protein [Ignavibacteria bacterium]|nr:RDD family protein [Ignavibacteria bacterium]MBI3765696.1 RDD family protein [Ignavibacteriales bacterium]